MKIRRPFAVLGGLALSLVVVAGCQPNPPAPTVRGYKFEIVRSGPFVVGVDDLGDPTALTDTPPEVYVLPELEECDPGDAVAVDLTFERAPYVEDGVTYDAWYVTGGVVQAIVPAEPECLPAEDGSDWAIVGYADTAADDGPLEGGQVAGLILDERIGGATLNPLYKLVK